MRGHFRSIFHYFSSSVAKSTSPLAVLRQKTGYPISKCKEALIKHDNDITAAELWLQEQAQKEGWAKAEKYKGRVTRQGVIGAVVRDNYATMIEVNCETDFVAKNQDFLRFVSQTTEAILSHLKLHPLPTSSVSPLSIQHVTQQALVTMGPVSDKHGSLGDLMAENIGRFGENISFSRACLMSASTGLVSAYIYNRTVLPGSDIAMGKYGSLVHLKLANSEYFNSLEANEIGRKLGQHIVGMNPQSLEQAVSERGVADEDNSRGLLHQTFLIDNSVTVGEWLKSHDISVTDFVRYGVGE